MSAAFAAYYVEANIVCIIVFGILLTHNHFNIDRQEKQIKYDRALLGFIFYFAVDCYWALIVSELVPKTLHSVVADVFLIYLFMSMITYFWLDYVMAVEQAPHRGRPINRFAVIFPFLVSTAALILNYLFAPQFLINEELDTLPGFSMYLITVPCIYLVAILFYTMRKAREEENRLEKRRHLFIGFLPLLTLAAGLVQTMFLPHVPIYCSAAMILMLMFYIQDIETRVSVDPLTSLNNRGQLRRYTKQKANLYMDDRLTVVVMMDINRFKAINDTYGHAEGDRALVIAAEALKRAINGSSMPSFLCRYGGDEFILILHPSAIGETEQLIRSIRGELRQACAAEHTPYQLSVSAGYDELRGGQDTIQSCIQRADKKLYLDKAYDRLGEKIKT